jgi:SAM-dependent methyltransferase
MNSLLDFKNIYGDTENKMDRFFATMVRKIFDEESEKANSTIGTTESEKRDRIVRSDGGYKCIHLGVEDFITQVQFVIKTLHLAPNLLRFVDVGCGVGQKVFLAHCFGFNSFGLELRKELIEAGENLFNRLSVSKHQYQWNKGDFFIQGNALTYPDYSRFDIIYFYCPLADEKLEVELEKKIAADAHAGAIVLGNLPKFFRSSESGKSQVEGWKRISDDYRCIYQKL